MLHPQLFFDDSTRLSPTAEVIRPVKSSPTVRTEQRQSKPRPSPHRKKGREAASTTRGFDNETVSPIPRMGVIFGVLPRLDHQLGRKRRLHVAAPGDWPGTDFKPPCSPDSGSISPNSVQPKVHLNPMPKHNTWDWRTGRSVGVLEKGSM